MLEEKQQIRNAEGKLLCELVFDGFCWKMEIKRGGHFTTISLYPSGGFHVLNDEDTDIHSVVVFG